MGTNYYWRKPKGEVCKCCGRADEYKEKHIGKSSGGWCFALHVYPEEGISTLADWENLFVDGVIRNEYGQILSASEMRAEIAGRESNKDFDSRDWYYPGGEAVFHAKNYSQRGPKNLLRHKLEGHCIGHGEGTWDYIVGDFF